MRRLLALPVIVGLLVGLSAVPVLAASPPANDDATGAFAIPATLPYTTTQDTRGATADSAAAPCAGSLAQAGVWYAYTATANAQLAVDARATAYPLEVDVYTGSPGSLSLFVCSGPTPSFPATAGTTYYLLFSEVDGQSTGGDLGFTFEVAPPPPTVQLSISPIAGADPKAGTVTVKGTVTCSGGAATTSAGAVPAATTGGSGVDIWVYAAQPVGRITTIQGWGSAHVDCGASVSWAALTYPNAGLFKPGQVQVSAQAQACDVFADCAFDDRSATVTARR